MAYDLKEAAVWPVNENGEVIVQVGSGSSNVTGVISSANIPIDPSTGKAVFKIQDAPAARAAKNTFLLMIGADHSDKQKWGLEADNNTLTADGNGYMDMLLDYGLKPYLATTTGGGTSHSPGGTTAMGWSQLKRLQDRGVEMLSHSHHHYQRWDRLNTGVFIGYSGSATSGGTATCAITATQVILTVTGGTNAAGETATLTRSNYATIASLLTAIAAVGGGSVWTATIRSDSSLTGNGNSVNLLPISGARNVNGTPSGDNRNFCCGGGMQIFTSDTPVTGTATVAFNARNVKVRVRTNNYLEVSVDGVVMWYNDLTAAAYDTFAELVAALNTTFNPLGIMFSLCDNGQGATPTFFSFMRGDELTVSMKNFNTRYQTPGNLALHPVVMEVGVTQDYIREQQYTKSIETAAANGVKLTGFAEPGNFWFPWHMKGYNRFKAYRGTLYSRIAQEPVTYPLQALNTPFFVRSNCLVSDGYSTPAHMTALVNAMADSPGHATCLLWHGLSTDEGSAGYSLGVGDPAADQKAINMQAFGNALKPFIASGQITPSTLGDASDAVGMGREPFNRFFNPRFQTAGLPIPTTNGVAYTNNKANIPGWLVTLSATSGATVSVNSDGMLVVNSPTGTADLTIKQSVILDRNTDWEYGFDVRDANFIAGTGALVNVLRNSGRPLVGNNLDGNTPSTFAMTTAGLEPGTSGATTGVGGVFGRLSLNKNGTGFDPARVVGKVGPFAITSGTNDTLSIQINGIQGNTWTLTAGAARTANEIVAEIRAKMEADTVFANYPEWWEIAKARRGGRASPVLVVGDLRTVYRVIITGTALTTIFGGIGSGTGYASEGFSGPELDSGLFALTFSLQVNIQGSMVLGRPYLKRLEIM